MLVLADPLQRRKMAYAGLPDPSDEAPSNKVYFQLAGRVLLIFLFIGSSFKGGAWNPYRVASIVVGLLAGLMIAVGFKAKYSAIFLAVMLSIANVVMNDFWRVLSSEPRRDVLKYCTELKYLLTGQEDFFPFSS